MSQDLEKIIADAQTRRIAASNRDEALQLADAFAEACRNSQPIPKWALAIRDLAAGYRLQKQLNDELRYEMRCAVEKVEKLTKQIKTAVNNSTDEDKG